MATLSADERAALRRRFAETVGTVTVTKPTINAALQAIEDRFEVVRNSFGTAIEAAAPGAFTAQQKAMLVKFWLQQKFERGG